MVFGLLSVVLEARADGIRTPWEQRRITAQAAYTVLPVGLTVLVYSIGLRRWWNKREE